MGKIYISQNETKISNKDIRFFVINSSRSGLIDSKSIMTAPNLVCVWAEGCEELGHCGSRE